MSDAIPPRGLRVAVVGTGPSACYAVAELLERRPDARVTVLDRSLTPYGLVRVGVAPDHHDKKLVTGRFETVLGHPSVTLRLGVEIGRDLSHDELRRHHHAVVYAVGTPHGAIPSIEDVDGPGSHAATDFASWYNGHPDHAADTYDLSGERAVIVGNGNVALDVARVLLTPPDDLRRTDIADHALAALRRSRVRDVVVVGRRGHAQAAFSAAELIELLGLPGLDVGVAPLPAGTDEATRRFALTATDPDSRCRLSLLSELPSGQDLVPGRRRLVLRFLAAPTSVARDGRRVRGLRTTRTVLAADPTGRPLALSTAEDEELPTSLVLWAIGHRATPIDGLPHDPRNGVVRNEAGRVLTDDCTPAPGTYVAGWVKRGPSGVIGSNRACAVETVDALLADADAGLLPAPSGSTGALGILIHERCPDALTYSDWQRIDHAERSAGRVSRRPRRKLTDRAGLLSAARP